ncbi:hypothetical protein AcV5_002728 [Taiwanofungus camphoratus]|nr:hypothetical protein AcV5_002728 [Antrodia cinnamomea]KAI0946978.1 hypothetical protein AcV7_009542 [Antrodia cinnamomea]
MSSKQDSHFSSGSISRNTSVPRTPSHESLSTHPLLSPLAPTPSSSSSTDSHSSTTASAAPPRYVPYTPRQRVAPTFATTGATMHPSISSPPSNASFHGDATSKLQLVNLKAAAQDIGLDAASTGWAILERLSIETDHGPEWNEIWNSLSVGKATLLLPLEPHPPTETITIEFIRDHIALCDSSARTSVPIVTLSGLRGSLLDETLTIRSTLSPTSKSFQELLVPATRSSALSTLPPLPLPLIVSPSLPSSSPTTSPSLPNLPSPYPAYTILSRTLALPLPPRASKPPLPPRPGARTQPAPLPTSRLSNPFASLFGRAAPTASPTTSSVPLHPDASTLPSATPGSATSTSGVSSSLQALTGTSSGSPIPDGTSTAEHGLDVPAYTISSRIERASLGRALSHAITQEMHAALGEVGVPLWAAERVERFTAPLFPLVRAGPGSPASAGKGEKDRNGMAGADTRGVGRVVSVTGRGKSKSKKEWVISSGIAEGAEDVAAKFQEFYADLEEAVRGRLGEHERGYRRGRGLYLQRREANGVESRRGNDSASGEEIEEKGELEAGEDEVAGEERREKRVREVMDAVERVVCSLFYDRLFLPPSADDASHDEALSSRIAAVNLLDLGLAHLGVDVGDGGSEVEAVVNSCGQTLTQLDTACRAPADKAAILVAAHKIIVDGLSRLPPIRLKPEDEIVGEKTPRTASFERHDNRINRGEGTRGRHQGSETESIGDDVESSVVTTHTDVPSPTIVLSHEESLAQTHFEPPRISGTITASQDDQHLSPTDRSSSRNVSPVRSGSPRSALPPPTSPTPVSGDIILPLMIFAVVKANPPRLVSNLLYIQRFRRQAASGGEEGYCLINLMAVAEFLENVDLAALGLGESERTVISTAALTPIPLTRSVIRPGSEPTSPQAVHASLRGRVEQQVDAIAGSANKVISGVVDTSFGVLRALLPGQSQSQSQNLPVSAQVDAEKSTAPPGFGLLRRDTGFSIASLAASLPGASGRARPQGQDEEAGQQMIEVPSRPGSSRSVRGAEERSTSEEESSGDDDGEEEEEEEHDTRSIRSFESMMSARSRRKKRGLSGRMSLTDRLASMPGLSRLSQSAAHDTARGSPPGSRRSSLLVPSSTAPAPNRFDTPASSRAPSPIAIRISPPNSRFLTCTEDDIKVSEVGELLREYKRLVEAVRAMGGFHDD